MSSLGLTPLPRNESAQSLNRKPSEPEKAVREPNNALQPMLGPSVNMNEQGIDPSAAEARPLCQAAYRYHFECSTFYAIIIL